MRDGKGIRNSKCAPHLRDTLTRGIWKLEENAHAKAAKPRQEYGAQTRIAKDVSTLAP
jgi:hypothetical protein